jgi:microcystin-dependent protein
MGAITSGITWEAGNVVTSTKMNAAFSDATIDITQVDTSTLVPVGTIIMYAGTGTPPGRYLEFSETPVSRSTYSGLYAVIGTAWGSGDGSTTFNIPPPGLFFRVVDGGSGNDPDAASRTAIATGGNTGDNVGSFQDDGFKSHTHNTGITFFSGTFSNGGTNRFITFAQTATTPTGGNETRPKNMYIRGFIRY